MYPVARSSSNTLEPGTIADSVAHLAVWARRAPRGFARVEYHSEFARSEADRRLEETLQQQKISYQRIELSVYRSPSEAMGTLLSRLGELEPAVVSITGFATAVPDDSRLEFLGHLTWNRERLAGFNHRQIWWMTPDFVDAFIHTVPDLASWFMVRLTIKEEFDAPIRGPQIIEPERLDGPKYRIDEALRRASSLVERFRRAKEIGARPSDLIDLAASAADAIVEVGAPNLTRELADRLLPEAMAIVLGAPTDDLASVRKLNSLALVLHEQGRMTEAEPLLERALEIVERDASSEDTEFTHDLNKLAVSFQAINRFGEAESLIRKALSIDEKHHGPEHPKVATDLNNLAYLLQDMMRPTEAEPLFRKALAIEERRFGLDHFDVATVLNNLAVLLKNMGRLDEAEPLYLRALDIAERTLGRDHPIVARDLVNLAVLLTRENRFSEAEPLFLRALEINERTFGPDHPSVANVLNNLGDVLRATNRASEAEAAYRRALAIWERSLGPDHPNVASPLNNLAGLLRAQNRLSEAEPLLLRVFEILLKFTRATGHQHRFLDNAIANYVSALQSMGQGPKQIRARLDEIGRPFGMSLGSQVIPK
jgi:tetratricopeptide (TPR) repeat protein